MRLHRVARACLEPAASPNSGHGHGSTLAKKALEPGNVLLGVLDELTFGVPLGFYHLAAGIGHGMYCLTRGEYEQATRELTPTALMVTLYAGGKGVRYLLLRRLVDGDLDRLVDGHQRV